jgi:hypothetical protein
MQGDDIDDGLCSLPEAIRAVNTRSSVNTGDCPAGTGNDIIDVPAGTYVLAGPLLPTESMEIRGAGRDRTVLAFAPNPLGCGILLATADKSVRVTGVTLTPVGDADAAVGLTGACVEEGTLRVRHAEVTGFGAGGLIARSQSGLTAKIEVLNALIDKNRNTSDGGGIAFVGAASWIWVAQSSIVDNVSEGAGGGIFGSDERYVNYVVNTTISGNSARRGGAIAMQMQGDGYLGLYWSTIVDNHAAEVAGGLHVAVPDGEVANTLIVGDILTQNTADADPTQANLNADWSSSVGCSFSLLDISGLTRKPGDLGGDCRFDVADAKLGPLMDMGGFDHLPIHPLLLGSPAIDAISQANSWETLQQRDSWTDGADDPPIGTGDGETPPWTVFGRTSDDNPLEDIGAFELSPRWETELLTVADVAGGTHGIVDAPAGYSHGAGTNLEAQGADAYVIYRIPVAEPATYRVALRIRTASDTGIFQLAVADAADADYRSIGSPEDTYEDAEDGDGSSAWRTLDLGEVTFDTIGQKYFRLQVVGKNESSAGYQLFLDSIDLTRP